jgi:hypothetical protein
MCQIQVRPWMYDNFFFVLYNYYFYLMFVNRNDITHAFKSKTNLTTSICIIIKRNERYDNYSTDIRYEVEPLGIEQ